MWRVCVTRGQHSSPHSSTCHILAGHPRSPPISTSYHENENHPSPDALIFLSLNCSHLFLLTALRRPPPSNAGHGHCGYCCCPLSSTISLPYFYRQYQKGITFSVSFELFFFFFFRFSLGNFIWILVKCRGKCG